MIKKIAFVLISVSIATALICLTPSCNNVDKKQPPSHPGNIKLLAVVTDSGVIKPAIVIRQISKVVNVDSITGKEKIVTDTLFGIEFPIKYKLPNGQIKDTLIARVIPKDSVNTHVENIPLQILLDRTKWKQQ